MHGVTVFGATGPTGELVCRALTALDVPVTAIMRAATRRAEYEAFGCEVAIADAMQAATLAPAMQMARVTCPVLLNLLGGNPFGDPSTWPDRDGVNNVTDAALAAGYTRCILVTSIGTGPSRAYVPESAGYLMPIIRLKSAAEEHLKRSGLDWCIVKPGGLGPPGHQVARGRPLITENHGVRGLINRADLADVILRVLRADAAAVSQRELYAVADQIEHYAGVAQRFPL